VTENLRLDSSTPSQLSGLQLWVIQSVVNQVSVRQIADRLTESTDQDFSEDTVRNVIKGLCGEKKRIPKKYHVEERYLKPVERHPDNSINYDVTQKGRGLLSAIDTPSNLRVLTGSDNSVEDSLSELGLEPARGDGEIRPHKCWWREEIKRKPTSEGSRFSWSDRRAILAEKELPWQEYDKEVPGKEQSERGELVHYKGWNVILFDDTVLIRYDRPVQSDSIFDVLDDWWSTRSEIVDWVQSTFPVLLRSRPLDVSMPLSTQEWGDVRNGFAEWIAENPEFQDDSPNSLFEVKDDSGERIFHVDTSPEDDLGNDVAEGEFPHSQFGAEHITNLKQAVRWMATLGVKPQDFSAAIWTRNNRSELEKLVEFDPGELEEKIESVAVDAAAERRALDAKVDEFQEQVSERVSRVESEVEILDREYSRLDAKVDGVSEGVQLNREDFSNRFEDLEGRIGDAVERVDGTRREVSEIESGVRSNANVAKVQAETLEQLASVQKSLRQQLEEERSRRREAEQQLQETVEDIREVQQRTVFDKTRDAVESVVEKTRSAVRGVTGRGR
jgi:predicted  nucleic acid-binding Zn-ribbon protein